jgi:HAD superfamily hydrolase (TIGR01509 family)
MKIYLAGPIFGEAQLEYNERILTMLEDAGHSVFLPQRDGIENIRPGDEPGIETEADAKNELFRFNRERVLEAELVIVSLDGQVPDVGIGTELGLAHENDVPIIGIRTHAPNSVSKDVETELNPMLYGSLDRLVIDSDNLLDAVESVRREREPSPEDVNAVIFDMDGVIVDSERHWGDLEEGYIFLEAVDSDAVTAAEIAGMNVNDVYDYLDEKYGTVVNRQRFLGLYDEAAEELYTEKAELLPGFAALVEELRERDLEVAVASSSPPHWIQMVLDEHELEQSFDEIVSAEHIDGHSKPDPDIYLHTASLLGVEPEECVAIEDSSHGVQAAKAAGMRCIGYRTPANRNQDLSRSDVVIEGPERLVEEFRSYGGGEA